MFVPEYLVIAALVAFLLLTVVCFMFAAFAADEGSGFTLVFGILLGLVAFACLVLLIMLVLGFQVDFTRT